MYQGGESNVSGGNVEMGARGRYIGRRAILSQLPHQREGGRGTHATQRYSTQTKPNHLNPSKQSKTDRWALGQNLTNPNQTLANLRPTLTSAPTIEI